MNTLIICLLIAIVLPYAVRGVVFHFMKNQAGGYNNNYPRLQQAQLTGLGARAVAAHQNGFESLAVFTPAAVTAMLTNHVSTSVQSLAIIYIISRISYNFLYLKNKATLRSLSWAIGFICCLAILSICLY